jgi:hypothetical protein
VDYSDLVPRTANDSTTYVGLSCLQETFRNFSYL